MNSFWCVDGYYLAEESSAASAGNLEWMRGILKDRTYLKLDELAASVPAEKSAAVFLPFLYASNLDPLAKGSLVGLESGYGEGEVIRAIYEGVAFSGYTHLERLLKSLKKKPEKLKLAGGVVNSPFWTQMFADVAGIPVETAERTELGCKGAAMSAGIAAGTFCDAAEAVARCVKPGNLVYPDPAATAVYRKKYEIYRAVEASLRPVWQAVKAFREENR